MFSQNSTSGWGQGRTSWFDSGPIQVTEPARTEASNPIFGRSNWNQPRAVQPSIFGQPGDQSSPESNGSSPVHVLSSATSCRSSASSPRIVETPARPPSLLPPSPIQSPRLGDSESLFSGDEDASHRSDSYWFDDGSFVLKVNLTLYNIHKSILRMHSDYFRELIPISVSVKTEQAANTLGTCVNPFVLDFRNDDFETFLSVIYPSAHGTAPNFSANQWLSVLSISTDLKFTSIRNTAIANLTDVLDEIDRIRFGRVHGVWDWLTEPYRILSEREEPLTLEEGNRLGMEDVIEIARKRERIAKGLPYESDGANVTVGVCIA